MERVGLVALFTTLLAMIPPENRLEFLLAEASLELSSGDPAKAAELVDSWRDHARREPHRFEARVGREWILARLARDKSSIDEAKKSIIRDNKSGGGETG